MAVDIPAESRIDYVSAADEYCRAAASDALDVAWLESLCRPWMAAYRQQSGRPTNITEMWSNEFSYLVDLEGSDHCDGRGPQPPGVFPRTVVAFGRSKPPGRERKTDDLRLRRWMGPTRDVMGQARDKGHFIAFSLGGDVIAGEPNIFAQRRDLNRGWSEPGKVFRQMEALAASIPGTMFFHRPIYLTESDVPDFLEVGLITLEKGLWVEAFDNRVNATDLDTGSEP